MSAHLQSIIARLVEHRPDRKNSKKHRDAPGHSHDVAATWDDDGKPCEWCLAWRDAEADISAAPDPFADHPSLFES